ncbi:hypothetical protein IFM89_034427 [Coptis chinensis]|uniref:Uncharacterized protein n=1 Tax=Coptis chinensis TaxID=261450 RepID=A0A835IZQ8_9MAGN|nr:hypothetical protein IFM89_034427 [Coptis chinensis]
MMSDRVDDLKTWSSVVIALKTTCLDDLLEKPGLQKTMQDELMNATQITFNALAIVDEISQILSKVNSIEFPVKINQNSSGCRRRFHSEFNGFQSVLWSTKVVVLDRRHHKTIPHHQLMLTGDHSERGDKIKALDVAGTFSDSLLFFGGPLEEGLFLLSPEGDDGVECLRKL